MGKAHPSPELLRKLLRYDPGLGRLFWRHRGLELFRDTRGRKAAHSARQWNDRYSGVMAFTTMTEGYLTGRIFSRLYRASRVIWAMETGAWPVAQIDHINGDRSCDKMSNLRDVSPTTNNRNSAKKSTNKSGHVGVCFDNSRGRWMAYANTKIIGRFDRIEDAVRARKLVADESNFTERHGK